MRRCIILNILNLTFNKLAILNNFISEYFRALDTISLKLQLSDSSFDLHYLTYSDVREYSFLPSDIILEARKDVWNIKKFIDSKGYNGSFKFSSCSIRLNKRWFRYVKTKRGNPCFRITYSPRKSFVIPIRTDRQFQRLSSFLNGGWYFDNISLLMDGRISVVLEKEFEKPEIHNKYAVGIDIGSSILASVAVFDIKSSKVVKQLYFGKDIAIKQRKYTERIAKLKSLASKGSHISRQHLRRLKHKQSNFVKTRSGQVAKEIVNLAKIYDAYISIEKLENLRSRRGKFNKITNRKINKIPYGKFKEFLKSNCEMLQVPLYEVDAYHTSKWCPRCGALNNGHYSGNYSLYKCKCGLIVNSDRKASLAIAVKSLLERTKAHSLTNLSSIQISKRRVPVNALMRSDDVGIKVAVQSDYQLKESRLI